MIYLYGLVEPGSKPDPAALEAIKGVTGPVAIGEFEQGWLIHGPAEDAEILPRRRHLLAHTRVLEAFLGERALLPMRFGLIAQDRSAVERMLAAAPEEISAQYDRVRGRSEFGLRVSFPRDAALEAATKRDSALAAEHARLSRFARPPHFEVAEFGRRLAERLDRLRGECQRKLLRTLAPLCQAHVLATPESDVQVLAMDVLIASGEADAFLAAAEEAVRGCADFAPGEDPSLRFVGPVPPFNFVRLTLSDRHGEAA